MTRVGIICGTGFAALTDKAEPLQVETPWGDVTVSTARDGPTELFFLLRHGARHAPPHRIVHRANIHALATCQVDAILALNAVGALDERLPAGSLLVPDDYIDMRKTTETFHDHRAVHIDVGQAYCPTLRALLIQHARAQGAPAHPTGTYVCTEGPRLETRAEVRMLHAMGGSVVGMTGCPEAALARERALCYASLCLVTNPAAGVIAGPLTAAALKAGAESLAPTALRIAMRAAKGVPHERACACRRALDEAAL